MARSSGREVPRLDSRSAGARPAVSMPRRGLQPRAKEAVHNGYSYESFCGLAPGFRLAQEARRGASGASGREPACRGGYLLLNGLQSLHWRLMLQVKNSAIHKARGMKDLTWCSTCIKLPYADMDNRTKRPANRKVLLCCQ